MLCKLCLHGLRRKKLTKLEAMVWFGKLNILMHYYKENMLILLRHDSHVVHVLVLWESGVCAYDPCLGFTCKDAARGPMQAWTYIMIIKIILNITTVNNLSPWIRWVWKLLKPKSQDTNVPLESPEKHVLYQDQILSKGKTLLFNTY